MTRRYVPHTERFGTIIGGDGSKWLSDLQAENDNMKYQSRTDQPGQRAESRLRHARWPHEIDKPLLGWKAAVLIGGLIGALLLVGIMQWPQAV